ncbi:MAG TPA: hypothetical protein VMT72_10785 [Pseudolabrys sp.]|nr:hypothetical protein [Pseudolabrys sp.]
MKLRASQAELPADSQLLVNLAIRPICTPQLRSSHTCALDFFLAKDVYDLITSPIMVRGGGMSGKDEMTRIEALGLPGSRKMPRVTTRHRKNRGMPPPAKFDIDTLPGSSNLTALEAAAVIRRTPGALEQWRRNPNHPLKWRYVEGRPLYRVDAVRDYLARCDKTTKPPQPHNARGDGRAARP